jgi:CheY-like chemotaxis protein
LTHERVYTVVSDEPSVDPDDPLGFTGISVDLSSLITTSSASAPFTLGIEGDWGEGKTSLMRRMEKVLDGDNAVTTVWYNAWSVGRGEVLEGLLKTVLDRIDPNILRRVARRRGLMTSARIAFVILAGWLRMGNIVNEIWAKFEVDARTRNEMRGLVTEAIEKWRTADSGVPDDRLLVVFVDDLDRCLPEAVFEVFEAVKLHLNVPRLVFVIGYDRSVVTASILESKRFDKNVTATQYVEKVIQISFGLGVPSREQFAALLDHYAALSGVQALLDDSSHALILDAMVRNPRRLKRFINSFVVEYTLLEARATATSGAALLRSLVLEHYAPEFARLFRDPRRDPITEFLDYSEIRRSLASGHESASELARRFLADHNVPASDPLTLKDIEAVLPEVYPTLADDGNFRQLLSDLAADPERQDIYAWLAKRTAADAASVVELTDVSASPSRELRVLWLDDHPEFILDERRLLEERGLARVSHADDIEQARLFMAGAARPFDLVISDVARDEGGDEETGFDDVESLRGEGFGGPVIFYTSRITPSRRSRARELDATIVNDPRSLIESVTALAAEPTPTGEL